MNTPFTFVVGAGMNGNADPLDVHSQVATECYQTWHHYSSILSGTGLCRWGGGWLAEVGNWLPLSYLPPEMAASEGLGHRPDLCLRCIRYTGLSQGTKLLWIIYAVLVDWKATELVKLIVSSGSGLSPAMFTSAMFWTTPLCIQIGPCLLFPWPFCCMSKASWE